MDLAATLRQKIAAVGDGPHLVGLRSVERHVEAAFRHLERGKRDRDDSAFFDSILRSNHAFEGSLKEAYRVLAGKDPENARPFDIESYLESNSLLHARVLSMFTGYRKEWRNPSTHDHRLSFNESEAFIATVTVCAFACLLCDQIAERLAFEATKLEAERHRAGLAPEIAKVNEPLRVRVASALLTFGTSYEPEGRYGEETARHLVGAASGFLAGLMPDCQVSSEERLLDGRPERADVVVRKGDQRVIVEFKHSHWSRSLLYELLGQLEHYMLLTKGNAAVAFVAASDVSKYELHEHEVPHGQGHITIVRPVRKRPGRPA
jgi:hypothetical protein